MMDKGWVVLSNTWRGNTHVTDVIGIYTDRAAAEKVAEDLRKIDRRATAIITGVNRSPIYIKVTSSDYHSKQLRTKIIGDLLLGSEDSITAGMLLCSNTGCVPIMKVHPIGRNMVRFFVALDQKDWEDWDSSRSLVGEVLSIKVPLWP